MFCQQLDYCLPNTIFFNKCCIFFAIKNRRTCKSAPNELVFLCRIANTHTHINTHARLVRSLTSLVRCLSLIMLNTQKHIEICEASVPALLGRTQNVFKCFHLQMRTIANHCGQRKRMSSVYINHMWVDVFLFRFTLQTNGKLGSLFGFRLSSGNSISFRYVGWV